jgi:3'(2'), 5'-bisphosphate nucleotidase
METKQLIDIAIHASILAGRKILEVYHSNDFEIETKEDSSPLTKADRAAHQQIMSSLAPANLPVLSEEGIHLDYAERRKWTMFWLVDPLDGTKEFIKRNDEFTVNIALIRNCRPIAGVIYVPVSGDLYAGIAGIGAYKITNPEQTCSFDEMQLSGDRLPMVKSNEYVIGTSRSHFNPETEAYIRRMKEEHQLVKVVSKGSSLKLVMIAEGSVTVYPKIGKTMEWDTGAGHAILKASGKNIFLHDLKTELVYNKEDLQNPDFIAM